MLWLRKSKKGFTLIELMVVVAIIGVLALLGLRVYSGQQDKAKNAVLKANCGTIQTLIQSELADETVSDVYTMIGLAGAASSLVTEAHIFNPFSGNQQANNGTVATTIGEVYVLAYDASDVATTTAADISYFAINGNNADNADVYGDDLTARK